MRLSSLGLNEPANQPEQTPQPPSLGSRLRQARETKGLTLDQISDVTKISVTILTAIENGETEKLRSAVSCRGFLKIYSEYLGLDSSEFLTQWTKTEPRKRQADAPSVTSKKLMQSEAFAERPILLSGKQILPALFIVLLLFIGFIIYRAYFAGPSTDDPIEQTAPAQPAHKKTTLQLPVPNNSQATTPGTPQPDKTFSARTAVFKQQTPALPSDAPPNTAGNLNESGAPPDSYNTASSHSNHSTELTPE